MGKPNLRPLRIGVSSNPSRLVLSTSLRRKLAIEETEHNIFEWLTDLTGRLDMNKIKWKLDEDELGIAVQNNTTSQWLVFNAVEGCAVPTTVVLQQIYLWIIGKMTPDNFYRLLTPQEQIRISNRVGLKPLDDKVDPQASLDRELKKREDLRRQGFDPQKEGLL